MKQIIPLLVFAAIAVGCKSVQPIAANTPSIVVKATVNRPVWGGRVDFPAGIYAPDFQTDQGVYYKAPTKIIIGSFAGNAPRRGGLFVAHSNASDQRQGMWVDHEDGSSGLLGATLSSITRVSRFKEPVPFEIHSLGTK